MLACRAASSARVGPSPWLEAGVGAIASQAFSEDSYGVMGLALLRADKPAPEVLAALLLLDPGRDTRQVGIVDAAGRCAAHTGQACVPEAGHHTGDGFTVQANMMHERRSPQRWPTPSRPASPRFPIDSWVPSMPPRAKVATSVASGRPRWSSSTPTRDDPGRAASSRVGVDDHSDPLGELTRLLELERGYRALERALGCLEELDLDGAAHELDEAQRVLPTVIEPTLIRVGLLPVANRTDQARDTIQPFAGNRALLATAARRYIAAGLFPADRSAIDSLLIDLA